MSTEGRSRKTYSKEPSEISGKRTSGVRFKGAAEGDPDHIRDHIGVFRQEKAKSGIFKKANNEHESVIDEVRRNVDGSYDAKEVLRRLIINHCGPQYWDFLESGNPWARFWVQLKLDIEVIPKSEFMYYVETILESRPARGEAIGTGRMRAVFLKKYGFESEEEADEYIAFMLEESDVANIVMDEKEK